MARHVRLPALLALGAVALSCAVDQRQGAPAPADALVDAAPDGSGGDDVALDSDVSTGGDSGLDLDAAGDAEPGEDALDAALDGDAPDDAADAAAEVGGEVGVDVDADVDADEEVPPVRNVCGGLAQLAGAPDEPCGACGRLRCAGEDALACEDPGANACGGCGALGLEPGQRCSNDQDCVVCVSPDVAQCAPCPVLGIWHMDDMPVSGAALQDAGPFGLHLTREEGNGGELGHMGWSGGAVGFWPFQTNVGSDLGTYFRRTGLPSRQALGGFTVEFFLWLTREIDHADPNPVGFGAGNLDRFRVWSCDEAFCLQYCNDDLGGRNNCLNARDELEPEVWHHVALTWNGEVATLWVDGEEQERALHASGTGQQTLRIGAHHSENGNLSNGLVDEVRLSRIVRYTEDFTPPQGPFPWPEAPTLRR